MFRFISINLIAPFVVCAILRICVFVRGKVVRTDELYETAGLSGEMTIGRTGFFSLIICTFPTKMTEFVALDCYICGKHL